jgi:hypothetical protein
MENDNINSLVYENEYILKEFDTIWRNYACVLPITEHKFDSYMKIIYKIRNNNYNFDFTNVYDKFLFSELIDCILNSIYNHKKYKEEDEKINSDREIVCCYNTKKYINKQISY